MANRKKNKKKSGLGNSRDDGRTNVSPSENPPKLSSPLPVIKEQAKDFRTGRTTRNRSESESDISKVVVMNPRKFNKDGARGEEIEIRGRRRRLSETSDPRLNNAHRKEQIYHNEDVKGRMMGNDLMEFVTRSSKLPGPEIKQYNLPRDRPVASIGYVMKEVDDGPKHSATINASRSRSTESKIADIPKPVTRLTVNPRALNLLPIRPRTHVVKIALKTKVDASCVATNFWLRSFMTFMNPLKRPGCADFAEFLQYVNQNSGAQLQVNSANDLVLGCAAMTTLQETCKVLLSLAQRYFFIYAASEGFHSAGMLSHSLDNIEELLDKAVSPKADLYLFIDCAMFLLGHDKVDQLECANSLREVASMEKLIDAICASDQQCGLLVEKNIVYVLEGPLLSFKYGKSFDVEVLLEVLEQGLRKRDYQSLVVLMENKEKASCTFVKRTLSVFLENMTAISDCIDRRVRLATYEWLIGCLNAMNGEWNAIAKEFFDNQKVKKWKYFFKDIYKEKFGDNSDNPLYSLVKNCKHSEEIKTDIFLMFLISSYASCNEERGLLDTVADTFLGLYGSQAKLISSDKVDILSKAIRHLPQPIEDRLTDPLYCHSLYNCVKCVAGFARGASGNTIDVLVQAVTAMCSVLSPVQLLTDVLFLQMEENLKCSPPPQHVHTFVAALLSYDKYSEKLVVQLKASGEENKFIINLVTTTLNLYEAPTNTVQKSRYKFIASMLKTIDHMLYAIADGNYVDEVMTLMKKKLSSFEYMALVYSLFERNWEAMTEKPMIDSLEQIDMVGITNIFNSWPWDSIYTGMRRIFDVIFANTTLDNIWIGCGLAKIIAESDILTTNTDLWDSFNSSVDCVIQGLPDCPTALSAEGAECSESLVCANENIVDDHSKICANENGLLEKSQPSESIPVPDLVTLLGSDNIPVSIKSSLARLGKCSGSHAIHSICVEFLGNLKVKENDQTNDAQHMQIDLSEEDSDKYRRRSKILTPMTKNVDCSWYQGDPFVLSKALYSLQNRDFAKSCKLRRMYRDKSVQIRITGGNGVDEEELDNIKSKVEQELKSQVLICKEWLKFECRINGVPSSHWERVALEELINNQTEIHICLKPGSTAIEQTAEKINLSISKLKEALKQNGCELTAVRAYGVTAHLSETVDKWNAVLGDEENK